MFFGITVFILGTIIGSFLNVVALRFNSGFSLGGRSQCFSCGKTLRWFELIPLASFIFQKGKCRSCHSKVSWQYIIVEVLTGFIFVAIFFKVFTSFSFFSSIYFLPTIPLASLWQTGLLTAYYVVVFSLLIVISIYDLKHKIIPDAPVYTFIFLSFLQLFFFSYPTLFELLAGPILFMPFFLLWFLSGGKWMGFGDAKLALGMGWFLGLTSGISALFIAFYTGAIVGVGLLFFQWFSKFLKKRSSRLKTGGNHLTMKSEIPFGPFLILGTLLVFFFSINFFEYSLFG